MVIKLEDFTDNLTALHVDPDVITKVKTDIDNLNKAIKASAFQKMPVDQSAYGASAIGASLGYHHSLAHEAMSEVLTAVEQDLNTFIDGLTVFVHQVNSVTDNSAAAFQKQQQALEGSTDFHHTRHFDHRHHIHVPQAPATGGE